MQDDGPNIVSRAGWLMSCVISACGSALGEVPAVVDDRCPQHIHSDVCPLILKCLPRLGGAGLGLVVNGGSMQVWLRFFPELSRETALYNGRRACRGEATTMAVHDDAAGMTPSQVGMLLAPRIESALRRIAR
ncbi:MAG: hypothetical protein ACI91F_003543 [Candidatus Binatia bacterium]|jgi:hypothetical protein